MKHCLIIFLFSMCFFGVFAQGWTPVGVRSLSMANASVALNDAWAYHHNVGALGQVKQIEGGVSNESRFLINEIQTSAYTLALPMKKGTLGFGAQIYGLSLYRSNRVGLAYSLALNERISLGVGLNYLSLRIADYGRATGLSGEVGVLARVSDKLHFGVSVTNLNRAKLNAFMDERFGTYLRAGFAWNASESLLLLAEVEKEVNSLIRPKGAMEYRIANDFLLRLGAAGNPLELTFGIAYQSFKRFKLEAGTAWHQTLGWSPHIGLYFTHKKKAKNE